jgi:hypothetical protein
MTDQFGWDPVIPGVPLVVAGLVILAGLLALEWRRRQKLRVARMICQAVVVLSLLGILCRPYQIVHVDAAPTIVLTPGYEPRVIDSLATLLPDASIFVTTGAASYDEAAGLESRDVKHLRGNPLWIVGSGLPPFALEDLRSASGFIPSPIPNGIVRIDVRRPVVAASTNHINGSYYLDSAEKRTIHLIGPAGAEDSASISGKGQTEFGLKFIPKVAGKASYRVEERDNDGNIIRSSQLPINIEPFRALEILIISDYPSFEMRYLKNYLAGKGHRIAVRSRVSKSRFHQEFTNRPREPLELLTPAILSRMDLLLIDHGSYLAMPSGERRRVNESVQRGLGLILLGAIPSNGTPIAFEKNNGPDTVRISAEGISRTIPILPVTPRGDVSPVIQSENGMVVAGCHCAGDLRIGYQLLRETYQFGLQNHLAAYAALWTPLLDRVTRTRASDFSISLEPSFPVITDEPVDVTIISSGPTPAARYDSAMVPLIENERIDGLWHGMVWASGNRWHTLASDSITFNFFDLPATEWEPLRAAQRLAANKAYITARSDGSQTISQRSWPILFFALFAIASGLLWVIPKI